MKPWFRGMARVLALVPALLSAADWPMLGGRPERSMISEETGLPTEWSAGVGGPAKNIRWSAPLGRVTFSTPVISGGRVFIGTDSDNPDPLEQRGVLKCFSEADGNLLWQATHEKLPNAGEDDDSLGVCSTPCVSGDRVYYVSNRGELVSRAVDDGRQVWLLDLRDPSAFHPTRRLLRRRWLPVTSCSS